MVQICEKHFSGDTTLDSQHMNIVIQATKLEMMARFVLGETQSTNLDLMHQELQSLLLQLETHHAYEERLMDTIKFDNLDTRGQSQAHRQLLRQLRVLANRLSLFNLSEVRSLMIAILDHLNEPHEIRLILTLRAVRKNSVR